MTKSSDGVGPRRLLRHSGKVFDPSEVTIQFNSLVLEHLRRLELLVQGKREFGADVFARLQSLTSGKPLRVSDAMMGLMAVSRDVTDYYYATGDVEAKRALADLIEPEIIFPKEEPARTEAMKTYVRGYMRAFSIPDDGKEIEIKSDWKTPEFLAETADLEAEADRQAEKRRLRLRRLHENREKDDEPKR